MSRTVILLVLTFISCQQLFATPTFQKGILDLRNIPQAEWKDISLNGEWEFYWEQLLGPSDFANKQFQKVDYLNVPGLWNNKKVGEIELSNNGCATYRAVVLLKDIPDRLAIVLSSLGTASRLYANGELLMEAGKVGQSKETSHPGYKPGVYAFTPTNDTIELIIQISNFHYARAGFWINYTHFGLEKEVRIKQEKDKSCLLLFIGSMIIIGIFLIFHYFQNRWFKYSFNFGLGCLIIALRSSVIDNVVILDFFPSLSWVWLIRLEYFSIIAGGMIIFRMFYSFYPDELKKQQLKIFYAVGLLLLLKIIVLQPNIFTKYLIVDEVYMMLCILSIIIIVIKALFKKKKYANLFLISFITLGLAFVNDVLYNADLIKTGFFISYAFVILLVSVAYIVSSNYSDMFIQKENLAKNLEALNSDLENRVVKRTAKIRDQYMQLREKNRALFLQNLELTKMERKVDETILTTESKSNHDFDGEIDTDNKLLSDLKLLLLSNKLYTKNDLTLEMLSEELNTNRTYLSRLINEHYNCNFNKFINLYRIKEARLLLVDAQYVNYTIEGIAHEVGFNSKSAFNTAFKELTGITPSYYKNKALDEKMV